MKKSLFVVALAVAFVLAFAATAMAVGPFYDASAYNPAYPGYLSWSWATTNAGETGSPHGNYATSTNKCQVCHAVHRADGRGDVLTALPLSSWAQVDKRTKACAFCHGTTGFSIKTVSVGADFTISPHGNCSRCHIQSPHGVGASVYPVLKEHLINTAADAEIANDIATFANNDIVVSDFDSGSAKGITLGTGYLCANCHSSGGAGISTVYAINKDDATITKADGSTLATQTGHRVTATATDSWNAAGDMGAFYSGRIAFNDANQCQSCHDAKRSNLQNAFPHGYVDASGNYAPKSTPGASLIWLTTAADADDARTILQTPGSTTGTADVSILSMDGNCLKCHLSGGQTSGVGVSY